MKAWNIVEKMLKDGMVEGQMHGTIRDAGATAGGYAASGALSAKELDNLCDLCLSLAIDRKTAAAKWREAVEFGRKKPIQFDQVSTEGGFGWNDPIFIGASHDPAPVVDTRWIEPQEIPRAPENPTDEIIRYLELMFEPGEHVGYTMTSIQKEDGRFVPYRGASDRTRDELLAAIRKAKGDLESAFGTWNASAGAWVRINPMDGTGKFADANVTAFRHALLEADDGDIGRQLAIIKEMEIPCTCVVYSGGKSVHALVRVDAKSKEEYKERVNYLFSFAAKNGFRVDEQNRNPSRLSRLPGIKRGAQMQYILATHTGKASWEEWRDWADSRADDLPDFVPLSSVIENPPPLSDELIAGVLRVGHKMLISGPSKAGKSFDLMELCIAIAEGLPWHGWPCKQGNVLYVNLELDSASCYHRFRKIYDALGIRTDNAGRIDVWNMRGMSTPLEKLGKIMARRVNKNQKLAIVIDPIYKVIAGDESNAEAMSKFCAQFDIIANSLNAATIYVHHHSKGNQGQKRSIDRSSGSGVFGRDPDSVLDLIELAIDDDRRLQVANQFARDSLQAFIDSLGYDQGAFDHEDRALSTEFLAKAQGLWPEDAVDLANAHASGYTAATLASGWRIEATLREFARPEPKMCFFRYPVHIPDVCGLLADAKADGEEPPWMESRRKKSSAKKKASAEKADAVIRAIEELGGVGAKISDIADSLGVTTKTVKNNVAKSDKYKVVNGVIADGKDA